MLLWLVFVVFIIVTYVTLIKPLQHWKSLNVPYIKPWPFVGNMGAFVFRRKTFTDIVSEMYNAYDSRYVGFYSFMTPVLLLNDIDLIKQIGVKSFDHFTDHRSFVSEEIDPLFGKNLFSLKGEKWRRMRAVLSPAFTGSKMRKMFSLISESIEQSTNYFQKTVNPNEIKTLEMKDIFTRIATDVIASTAFGIKCDSVVEKNTEFYLMGKDATNFKGLKALKFFGYSISPKIMNFLGLKLFSDRTGNFFRDLVVNNMGIRERDNIIRPDMIHLLMEARKGRLRHEDFSERDCETGFATVEESQVGKTSYKTELGLTDDEITAQAILFFFGGFETISNSLCHTAYELALNEDIQQKLQKEIDEKLLEHNGKVTYEVIISMKYLDMVISESLRKWPSLPATDRVCVNSYTIQPENEKESPIPLKKDNPVWIPIYAIHRNPKYFPNPDKFDPERFSDENKSKIRPFSYLPFGVGPRNCIGSRFALLEAKTIFFHLLSKFSIVIVEKSEIPLQITRTELTINSQNGFWLGLKRRQ